jgi:ribosomal protein S18 acetylase RimI-like enzyme
LISTLMMQQDLTHDAITTRIADLSSDTDAAIIVDLVNDYAQDPMGGGKPLPEQVKLAMVAGMKQHPGTLTIIAEFDNTPVGLANCFTGFSTFRAKPLINIHDLCVHHQWRGKGVGAILLEAVADEARNRGCCKVTLEVRDDNPARRLYDRAGYKSGDVSMWFLSKDLE